MIHFLIKILFVSSILGQMPTKYYDDWTILQDYDIWIGYTELDFPWCKASFEIPYSIDEILTIIEDVNEYSNILDSVIYSSKDKNDIAHIQVHYPFPFSDRDYIVKFEKYIEEEDVIYSFKTNKNLNLKLDDDFVRLINMQGEWRLSPIEDRLTQVSYMWNGELQGGFPHWSLNTAWRRQGKEVLGNLREKLEATYEN